MRRRSRGARHRAVEEDAATASASTLVRSCLTVRSPRLLSLIFGVVIIRKQVAEHPQRIGRGGKTRARTRPSDAVPPPVEMPQGRLKATSAPARPAAALPHNQRLQRTARAGERRRYYVTGSGSKDGGTNNGLCQQLDQALKRGVKIGK